MRGILTQRHGDTVVAKVRLGDLISEAKPIRCNNRDLPVLSMTMKDGLVLQSEKFKKRVASEDVSNYKVVSSNQLVVSFPIDEGVLAVQQIVEEGIVSPAYAIWNIDEDKVIPKYLESYLRSPSSLHYYKSKLRGTTVRRRSIPKSDFLAMELVLPTLKNQEMALRELDLITEMIRNREAQLARLDTLVKAKFEEMFGDGVHSDKCGVQSAKLGDVCEVGSSKRIFQDEYVQSGIPFYRSKEIVELSHGEPISTLLYITEERYAEIRNKYGVPKIGDLLVTAVGTIGEIWIVDSDKKFYYKDGNLMCIHPGITLDSVFLRDCLFRLIAKYKATIPAGTAYSAFTIDMARKLIIPLPPLPLQKEFAAVVEEVDKSKAAIKKTIENLKTLYKARLQEYFA